MKSLLRKRSLVIIFWIVLPFLTLSIGSKTSFADSPTIGRPTFTHITQTTADASWTTSVAFKSNIFCINSMHTASSAGNSDTVSFTHSVHLANLLPGNSYSCQAHMTYFGVYYSSPVVQFWTAPASTPTPTPIIIHHFVSPTRLPVIITNVIIPSLVLTNPYYGSLTSTGVSIYWTTNHMSDSHVQYYTDPTDATPAGQNDSVTRHAVILSDLHPNTTYFYRVKSKDTTNHEVTSGVDSFRTPGLLIGALTPRDTTPPVITSLQTSHLGQHSVIVNWTANEESDSWVFYSPTATDATFVMDYELNNGSHTFIPRGLHKITLPSLTPATTYSYRALSKDRSQNFGVSERKTFTTLAETPNQAPAASQNDQSLAGQGDEMNNEHEVVTTTPSSSDDQDKIGSSVANLEFEKTKQVVQEEMQKELSKNPSSSEEFGGLDTLVDNLSQQKIVLPLLIIFVIGAVGIIIIFVLLKKFIKKPNAHKILEQQSTLQNKDNKPIISTKTVMIIGILFILLIIVMSILPFLSGFLYTIPYYFQKNDNDKTLEKIINQKDLKIKVASEEMEISPDLKP